MAKKNYNLDKFRNKSRFAKYTLHVQKANSRHRGHRLPEYDEQTLHDWLMSQEKFHVLFEEWKQSGWDTNLKPSIDRKSNDVHYCLSNIQLMTWEENRQKFRDDCKLGVANDGRDHMKMPIIQLDKKNRYIDSYESISEASRVTGIAKSGIARCVKKERKSAGGFKWVTKD